MGRFKLSAGFSLIPEGSHIFKITAVSYDEDFGRLVITMVTKNGLTHNERFDLLNADGSTKDSAMRAFSYFAQTALQDWNEREIDEQELVGKYIRCDVVHRAGTKLNDNGEPRKYANLTNKYPADGYEGDAPAAPAPAEKPAAVNSVSDMMNKWGL